MNAQPEFDAELESRNRRIGSAAVKQLCGGISDMGLWRWLRDQGFPQPQYIGNRRYWRAGDVLDWLENRPTQYMPKKADAETPAWAK